MEAKKYFRQWENLEYTIKNYQRFIIFLSLIVILETCAIFSLSNTLSKKQQSVVVVPGAVSKITYEPGKIPLKVVEHFGFYLASLYLTFTPTDYMSKAKIFLKYTHPEFSGEFQKALISQNEKITKNSYAQEFVPIKDTVYINEDGEYVYKIKGITKKFLGEKNIGEEEDEYVFLFKKVIQTEDNPYGLAVSSVSKSSR